MVRWRDTLIALAALAAVASGSGSAWAKSEKELLAIKRAKVTLAEAITTAQREVPGGKVIDADIVSVRGTMSYAVEILKDGVHVIRIDLQKGSVLSKSLRRVPASAWKQMAIAEAAKVMLTDAVAIAQRALPGGIVASADISIRRSGARYVVDIEKDGLFAVHVDLKDGRILSVSERLDE